MNESRIALGKRIQLLRRRAGLTQEQLAERTGLSLKHLGELERGRANPTFSSLENLASSLDVPLVAMLDFEHEGMAPERIREELELMIGSATDNDLKIIYRIVRALVR